MAEDKRNIITEEGRRKLQEQLDYLVGTRRTEIAHQIEVARGFGDLSENAEYDAAKAEQAKVEEEISRLTNVLRTAIVVADSDISTDKVSIGTTVKVENLKTGTVVEYSIVGADEADPYARKISTESPIGGGLLGAIVGQTVAVDVPAGTIQLKVLEIFR